MSSVRMIANVGVRRDDRKVQDAFLHLPEDPPCVRLMTADNVWVDRFLPFELAIDSSSLTSFDTRRIQNDLVKALSVVILIGLTSDQKNALRETIPNLKINT